MSEAGDALATHPGLVSGPIPSQGGPLVPDDTPTPAEREADRRSVPRRLRFEVLRRDDFTCRYCGASAPDVALEVDHVIPAVLGGGNLPSNLVTACEDCNRGKASTTADAPVVEDIDKTAELVERARRLAFERRQVELAKRQAFFDDFLAMWNETVRTHPEEHWGYYGGSWKQSLEKFMRNGLTEEDLFYWARYTADACPKKPWNYFASLCWKEVGRREEEVRRLIEDGEV